MAVQTVYAQIYANTVQNIIVCDDANLANWLSHQTYGDTAQSVECTQYPCHIGDKYEDGKFFRKVDGEWIEIMYVPTSEEQVDHLTTQNKRLENEITELQLALVGLYEGMEVLLNG